MGAFEDLLKQKTGAGSKGSTPSLKSSNLSTRSVTPASELPTSAPAPSSTRPVRPTMITSLPSFNVGNSPLLQKINSQPVEVPSEHPVQDVIAKGASKLAGLPGVKQTLGGLGNAIEYVENLLGVKQAGGALAGAYNNIAEGASAPFSEWGSQARKNIGKLATSDSGLGPIKQSFRSIVEGINNPEEARARASEIIEGRTQGMGPVSKFSYSALSHTGIDPLSLIPATIPGNAKVLDAFRYLASKSTSPAVKGIVGNAIRNAELIPDNAPLALPQGRGEARFASAMERSNLAPNQEPIIATGTVRNPEPLGLPAPNLGEATRARITTKQNEYTRKLESLFETANKMRLTPGKELEEVESLWSQMAGPRDPDLNTLIELAYPSRQSKLSSDSLSKARNLQQSREVAGVPLKAKSMSDRYQSFVGDAGLPRERVGFERPEVEVIPPTRNFARTEEVLKSSPEPMPKPLTANSTAEEVVQAIQKPRVRDKVYNFMDEAEQAARARRAARRNIGFTPGEGNEAVDLAIIGASKMVKGTIKATDWTEAMVQEFGEDFRKKAPAIYQQSKEFLRTQERKASKEGQAAADFNAGAGDAASFESKISREVNPRKKSWSQRTEQLRTQFTDKYAAGEGLEKRIKGKVGSAEESLYKSMRNFAGVSEKAHQIVKYRLNPIIKSVEKSGYTADDLGKYALAKHAKDVNEAGYMSGFTNSEIDDVIRKYENAPGMEEARTQLMQVNKDMLDSLVDSGVISASLRDTLNERWKNYMPLFRSFEEDPETFAAGMSQSLKSIGDPVKALKGSKRNTVDPLENMVKNIFQTVTAAERNKVKLQLSDLAKADKEGTYIRKLSEDEAVGKKNVIPVRENGETVRYEVEPEVYKAFSGLDNESSNMLMNVLSAPASILRAGATLTPDFALRNPMRDVVAAFVNSKSGFNPVVDFPIGLYQTITKGKHYKDWIDNLGAYGNSLSMDRKAHREALQTVLKQPASKKFVNVVTGKSLIKLLRTVSDVTESATKVGEYRKAIKKGATPQEAAYRARDLMDFARSGTSIKPANRIISFLNANIQGKSKLLRSIKERPAQTLTKMFTGVTVPTVGIYLWNHKMANDSQRQTMDEAPDWMKDSFWMVAVPGTDTVARIPKPFDIAPVFANLPERVLDNISRNNPVEFADWAKNSLSESALPNQISGLLPLIEGMSGYSFFRQGDIVPQREQGLELADQYDPIRTSEVGKLLASGVRKATGEEGAFKNFGSPRIMDNTIKGLTAGLGTYATDAVDAVLQGKVPFTNWKVAPAAVDRPVSPEKRIEQQPLARSFLVDPLGSTKSMDQMYRDKEKLSKEEASTQLRNGDFTKLGKKTFYLPQDKAEKLDTINDVSKAISEINKEIRAIESDKVKSAKQKRNEIDPLLAERNRLSIEVMKNQKR